MKWIVVIPSDAPDSMKEKLDRHFRITEQAGEKNIILRRDEWNQDLRPHHLMAILSLDGEIDSELDKIDEWFLNNVVGFREERLVITKIGPHLSELNEPAKKKLLSEILTQGSEKNFFDQARKKMSGLEKLTTELPSQTGPKPEPEPEPKPEPKPTTPPPPKAEEPAEESLRGFNFHDTQQTNDVIQGLMKIKKAGIKIELPDLRLAIGQGTEENEISWDEMIAMVRLIREFGAQNVKWKKEIMFK